MAKTELTEFYLLKAPDNFPHPTRKPNFPFERDKQAT